MKRLSSLLIVCILGFTLAGCGEDKEKKLTSAVEVNLQAIQTGLDNAKAAKGSLDSNLQDMTRTSDQLRDQIASLRSSIDQLNASLSTLQTQLAAQKSALEDYKDSSEGGFWKWVFILLVLVAVVFLIWKFIKPPKPFDEEEEEDFSAFDEELGYEEPAEDIGGEDSGSGPKSGS